MKNYNDIVELLRVIYNLIDNRISSIISYKYCNMTNIEKRYINNENEYIKLLIKTRNHDEFKNILNKCEQKRKQYDDCNNDKVKINKLLYTYDYTEETYDEIFTLYNKYSENDVNITIDDIKNIPTIIKNYLCIMDENFNIEDLKIDDEITLETINNKIVENIVFYIKQFDFDMYDNFVDLFTNTIKSLSQLNQFFKKERKSIYNLDKKDKDTYINALNYTISNDNISIKEINNTIESYVNSYTNVYRRYLDAVNGYKEYIIDKYKNINNKDKIISNMNIFFKNFNISVSVLTRECNIDEEVSAENCSFYYLNDKMNEYD